MHTLFLVFSLTMRDAAQPQYWAIAMDHVREVVQNPRIYPLPRVPDFIAGCLWYRGRILTVCHLPRLLIGDRWKSPAESVYYVVVLDRIHVPLALWVGENVQSLTMDEWTPMDMRGFEHPLVTSIFRWQQHTPVYHIGIPELIAYLDHAMIQHAQTFHRVRPGESSGSSPGTPG